MFTSPPVLDDRLDSQTDVQERERPEPDDPEDRGGAEAGVVGIKSPGHKAECHPKSGKDEVVKR